MQSITKNTLVSLTFRLEDTAGSLLEENEELMYLHGGYGLMFPKVEAALEGKAVDDTFSLLLEPEDAFGAYDPALELKEPLSELPEDVTLGMELEGADESMVYVVENIEEGYATLNANHEMAGIPLKVSGKILQLEQLTQEGAQAVLEMDHHH